LIKNAIDSDPFNLSTLKLATMIFRAEVLFFPDQTAGKRYFMDDELVTPLPVIWPGKVATMIAGARAIFH
jgi:hypothetical protein